MHNDRHSLCIGLQALIIMRSENIARISATTWLPAFCKLSNKLLYRHQFEANAAIN
jgi:hypothetical protein